MQCRDSKLMVSAVGSSQLNGGLYPTAEFFAKNQERTARSMGQRSGCLHDR
jgi:hypothetical protein